MSPPDTSSAVSPLVTLEARTLCHRPASAARFLPPLVPVLLLAAPAPSAPTAELAAAPEAFEMCDRKPAPSRFLRTPVDVMWSAWQCVLKARVRVSPASAATAKSRST